MQSHPYRYAFPAMGSDCQITLYAEDERHADRVSDLVMAEVWRIENKYSRYIKHNCLSNINQSASSAGTMAVDEETAMLLDYALTAFKISHGLFDISSGVLRRIWDFSSNILPSQADIAAILPLIGLNKVDWNRPILHFPVPGMELDLGGLGKEYALDRSADICLEQGIRSGLLDFGGDIRAIGPKPDGTSWQIGIRHPLTSEASSGKIELYSGAIASSGSYERYIESNGKRYCHIFNPQTGWPVAEMTSVTVMAEQCLLSGTLSTIAMLKENEGKQWLAERGVQHLWLDAELNSGGNIRLSN